MFSIHIRNKISASIVQNGVVTKCEYSRGVPKVPCGQAAKKPKCKPPAKEATKVATGDKRNECLPPKPYINPCEKSKPCVNSMDPRPCYNVYRGKRDIKCGGISCIHEETKAASLRYRKIALAILTAVAAFAAYKSLTMVEPPPVPESVKPTRHKKKPKEIEKIPLSSGDIPDNVQYLLIGGGTASFAAFRAIKIADPTAKVLIISKDPHKPYMRPPLTKELFWGNNREKAMALEFRQWSGVDRSIFFEPDAFYTPVISLSEGENGGVAVAQGWSVKQLDVQNRKAILEDGKVINYEKCLIATGGSPRKAGPFEDMDPKLNEKITTFRDIDDFKGIENILNSGARNITIVGGGLLGTELASSLVKRCEKNNIKINQIFKESGNLFKILPPYLAAFASKKVEESGVEVMREVEVSSVDPDGDKIKLSLSDGKCFQTDHIILATGIVPNTGLAEISGLEIDRSHGGFVANSELQARTDLYVAGDCLSFYDHQLGRRRLEHHDHALLTGKLAGENMAGGNVPIDKQSMFWSEFGLDIGFEAVGVVCSSLSTVGVFANDNAKRSKERPVDDDDPSGKSGKTEAKSKTAPKEQSNAADEDEEAPTTNYNRGVIFYLKDSIVVGILLWNLFDKIELAREIIKQNKKYEDLNEVAKLLKIHE